MALRNINEGVSGYNSKLELPKDRYIIRCIEEKFAPNNNGNPMITRQWEIVSPEVIKIGGHDVSVVGAKITEYIVTKVNGDPAKSDKAFGRFRDGVIQLGYKESSIDDENPPLVAKGKIQHAILYSQERPQLKDPTPEQVAAGQKYGDPILDPVTDQPIIAYQIAIDTLLGVATLPSPF